MRLFFKNRWSEPSIVHWSRLFIAILKYCRLSSSCSKTIHSR